MSRPPTTCQGRRRGDARRAPRPEHAGLRAKRGRPARPDPARAVHRARRGLGASVRAVARAHAGLDLALAGARAGARGRPRGDRLGRAHRRQPTRRSSATSSARPRSRRSSASRCELLDRAGLARVAPYVSDRHGGRAALPARGRAPIRCSRRRRSRARPRALGAGMLAADRGALARADGERWLPRRDECRPDRVRTQSSTAPGPRRATSRGLAGAPFAVEGVAADGLCDRAGAAARRASRLLRRRPVDAEAGAPGNAPDRRRLAGAARRPDGSARRRLRRARPRTSASRPRSCPRSPGPRSCAPGRGLPGLPDERPAIGELRARVRGRALPVPRLHLRAATGRLAASLALGEDAGRRPQSVRAVPARCERRRPRPGDRDRLERRRRGEPVLLAEGRARPPRRAIAARTPAQ